MDEKKHYLSQEKYDELKDELDFLITKKRQEIAEQLEYARSLGDLSENAEYQEARQIQGQIESRIRYLTSLLKMAEIVAPHKADHAEVGATITIENLGTSEKKVYQMVGSEEANTAEGRISLKSPLGQAMLGKKKGEAFTFVAPSGKKTEYKILKID